MAIQSSKKNEIFNEINITPLTDIFLVLLIIMMVIAPLFQSVDKNITLPQMNNGTSIEEEKVTISVTNTGEFYINTKKVSDLELETELSAIAKKENKKIVIVRADAKTKNGEIIKIMRAAKASGYEKLTIAGEPLSRKEARLLQEKEKTD